MSENPLVSVIIPFLNGGDWLTVAIDSAIGQTYANLEIIVVDDGSEEVHSKVGREAVVRYPGRVRYADHPGHANRGVTISRNLGIELSRGELIAFLDADDCWLPGKIQEQVTLFGLYPQAQMICEASVFWYSWNNPAAADEVVKIGVDAGRLYQPPELMQALYPLGTGQPPCPTGILLTRAAFDRSGGFEPSFSGPYQLYEDQAFLAKIYLNEAVYISGSANNLYRKREGSLTGAGDDEVHYKKVRLFFLQWLQRYLEEHHVDNKILFNLISTASIQCTGLTDQE